MPLFLLSLDEDWRGGPSLEPDQDDANNIQFL